MRYLFWNTNRKVVDEIICSMIKEYKPAIIVLAEYEGDRDYLIKSIKINTGIDYMELQRLACKVCIFVNEKIGNNIEHYDDHSNYTIKRIPYNSYNDFHIVVFVHLPSKLYGNKEKNRHLLEQITCKVNEIDQNRKRKVIILGDFNINPYEDAMTYLTGCNAVSSKDIAMKIWRKDRNEKDKYYYYYYNPMWNFLGDRDNINGTYYYDKTSDHSRYWNTFDQFVVSPALIKDIDEIKIIKHVGAISLENRQGIPDIKISDHYPIYFKLGGS